MIAIRIIIALIALNSVGPCFAAEVDGVWRVDEILKSNTSAARLLRAPQKEIVTVTTQRVRRVADAFDQMTAAAGVSDVDLYISGGFHPNAFAFLLGDRKSIAISIGMLNLIGEYPDRAAALFGHELAHLHFGHHLATSEVIGTARKFSIVIGIVLGAAGMPLGGTVARATVDLLLTPYSRQNEREADLWSISVMRRAGIDPRGIIGLFHALAPFGARQQSLPFLATHPGIEERLSYLSAELEGAAGHNLN